MMIFLFAAAAALASGAVETSMTAPAEPPKEKKICKSEEVTGSLARRVRICRTAAQWRVIQDDTVRDATRLIDSGTICSSCSSTPG